LAVLSAAHARMGDDGPSLRLANLMQLGHNMSVDLYLEQTIAGARLVVVRLLGGIGYWPYGVEQLSALCREQNIALAVVPGDDHPDLELAQSSTLPADACHKLWQYCAHGGRANAENFLKYGAHLLGFYAEWREPAPLIRAGIYWPGEDAPGLEELRAHWVAGQPVAAIIFYRALVQAEDLAPVDALIQALAARRLNPLPIFAGSMKDGASGELIRSLMAEAQVQAVFNLTGFAISTPGQDGTDTHLTEIGRPVLQVILSGGAREAWEEGTQGLSPRDLAMNVALPEVDGRIITRAISFKQAAHFDASTEVAVLRHEPIVHRVDFVADLGAAWVRLGRAAP
ncbi:MAG: cobaltochelatase subunit CobN, partial [Rhodospirillales bacterium]|nr:cobaltochelatase subunit CobN [Rhodospirillales bacterium]